MSQCRTYYIHSDVDWKCDWKWWILSADSFGNPTIAELIWEFRYWYCNYTAWAVLYATRLCYICYQLCATKITPHGEYRIDESWRQSNSSKYFITASSYKNRTGIGQLRVTTGLETSEVKNYSFHIAFELRWAKIHCEYHVHNWPLAADKRTCYYNFNLQLHASMFEHVSV